MNWKNSLLVLCLFSAFSWASTDARHYQNYQRLQLQLQKDPAAALPAIELFVQQVQLADDQTKMMAAYLQLQACIATNRYRCATTGVETLLSLNQDETRKTELLKLSAQLHYQIQSYATVSARVNDWRAVTYSLKIPPQAKEWAELYSLKAYALYHQQEYLPAIRAMEEALTYQVNEPRQLFVLGLYQRQADWHNVNRVLKSLVSRYANKAEYWEKYAYSFLKLEQDQQAMNALGSAYKSGRLPQRSILLYAQMLLRFNAPERAAKVLEETPSLALMPDYNELLTQSYLLARDKQKAAQLLARADHQDTVATRGMLAYQQGQWQQAAALFQRLDSNQKHNHYWLLLAAISEFELKRWKHARLAFQQLAGTRYEELAEQWLSQIDYLTQN